jgi:WD40 repeat protein
MVYSLTSAGGMRAGWPVAIGSPVQSAPAIASNGTVLVGSDNGTLVALASDGTELWAAATGGAITSSAAVAGMYVVVGSDDGGVHAFDLADGSPLWSRPTGSQVRSSPAVSSDGTVYVGSCDGNLYALNLADGSDRFAFVLGGFVIASPAIGPDGVVYAGSDDDRLYAIGTRLFTGSLTVAPIVDTVSPGELRQGTTATVRVEGYHFREGMQLDLGSGITVGEVQMTSERELTARVVVGSSAHLGEREAVATASRTLRGTRAAALTVGFDCRRADLSGDGVVDGLDLALLASRFGAAGVEGADLTGDALVDGADLSLLAARFGGRSVECR